MGRAELHIEHRDSSRVRKQLRVKARPGHLFVIGSSNEADLRIAGGNVDGCHAALHFRDGHWYLCDLTGSGATTINGQAVVEQKIVGDTDVRLGDHTVRIKPKELEFALFNKPLSEGDKGIHQVVVRYKGNIVDTWVLDRNTPYEFNLGQESQVLAPPTAGDWVVTNIGKHTVYQRLAPSQDVVLHAPIEFDRDIKKPFVTSATALLILMLLLILWPKPQPTKVEDAVLAKNQMEMIFNAKAVQKKRAEVQKLSRDRLKGGGNTQAPTTQQANQALPEQSTAPQISGKAQKALTSLRQSGLQSLVGKIAKRSNKNGILVGTAGVSADREGTGRAIYSLGQSTTGGGGQAAAVGENYRLGGVGTQGKGGGASDYKGGTGLAGGNVGLGDVSVVDEETVIEGGLDRDVIADFIKKQLGQIRYCYERQLSSNPDLYGKVQVRFTIMGDGKVGDPKIDVSTMKNATVEGCIIRRVAGWQFPQPKGGTLVKVSYPFLFKSVD